MEAVQQASAAIGLRSKTHVGLASPSKASSEFLLHQTKQFKIDNYTWSPAGRLHQVEYAMEAVKQGSAAIGLRSRTHVGCANKASSELFSHQKKLFKVDNHTWSPAGRLHSFSLEYAVEAVRQGSAAAGLRFKTRVVLATVNNASSELLSHRKKMFKIDNHIGIAMAGLTPDGHVLSRYTQQKRNWSRTRYLQQKRNWRFRVRSSGGGGDDKESGTSVTTEEKEPEAKDVNQLADPTPSSSGNPPPGDGEELPIQLLPHAFSFVELIGPEKVDPEDIKTLKEKVFGYTTFWITGQEPFGDLGEGVLLLGNLRGNREEVFAKLQRRLKETMGSKYDMFMVEEPNAEDEDPRGGPRVSFVLLRKEVSDTGPTTLWQYILAIILFVLTGGTCLELGISSQLSRLPPEVVQYITNPETTVPPDLQVLVPYVDSALPLAYGVFGVQLFHELGHRLAAAPRGVKLGIPYFIPNITLGSFGAITQFKSICPDRTSKFDVSMAGPLAGGLLSLAMFGVGLILSTNPEASSQVVQVPSLLLQGSLLLGLVTRAALGYTALHATTVSIHPLVIAGWCGLTTTAFNLLPVGCLDGGRAIQAALGKTALNISGLITYLLLGLGVLGGPLSLPWGLYIIIAQRTPEKPCLNDVSDVGSWRKGPLLVISLLVIATLLPVWDELAEELGIGIVNTLQVLD